MSKIEWTEKTWNPVVGCTILSPGCTNCYAMKQAHRIQAMYHGTHMQAGRGAPYPPSAYDGTTQDTKAGPVWTGKVAWGGDDKLLEPLRRKRPTTYFVNSMSDLFHEDVPDEWIDRVFAVMALCPQHTFQVLTKRAKRMREYCSDPATPFRVAKAMDAIKPGSGGAPDEEIRAIAGYPGYFASSLGLIYTEHRGPRRPMRPDVGEQGHSRVQLHREGAGRYGDRHLVHRLILETFVGPAPSPDSQGRHRDGNAKNNALHNLTWGTQEENWTDAKRHGSHRRYSKLTIDQAEEIKRRHGAGETGESLAREFEISATQVRNIAAGRQWNVGPTIEWPLRNVWKGVSAEDQTRADERVPDLLATPAAVRFVSAEPLLGPIDFSGWFWGRQQPCADCPKDVDCSCGAQPRGKIDGEPAIDWIIVGGESGPNARPMHPDWPRAIRDQCAAAGVAFFFKQFGEFAPDDDAPGAHTGMVRVGKKTAGRLLDGRTHDDMPARRA